MSTQNWHDARVAELQAKLVRIKAERAALDELARTRKLAEMGVTPSPAAGTATQPAVILDTDPFDHVICEAGLVRVTLANAQFERYDACDLCGE